MSFRIHPSALGDASAAANWYGDQRSGLGDDFLDEVLDVSESIRRAPESFARPEEYSGAYDVRRCVLKRFPFMIVFQRDHLGMTVIAVAHARRQPVYWSDRPS